MAECVAVAPQHVREARLLQHRGIEVVRELADLGSDVDQLPLDVDHHVPGLGVGRHLSLRRAQHEAQRRDLLHDAVVQLARDPGSLLLLGLHQPLVERVEVGGVPLDAPHTDAIGAPEQRREGRGRERAEPDRLVVGGTDEEIQLRGAIAPHAVTIGGDHAKGMLPGRQIGVERLPPRTGVVPIRLVPLEPVAELHFLRNQQGRGRVVDLHVTRVRGQPEGLRYGNVLPVDRDGFDVCHRRRRALDGVSTGLPPAPRLRWQTTRAHLKRAPPS